MKLFIPLVMLCLSYQSIVYAQVDNYSAGSNGQKLDWMMYYLDNHYVDSVNSDSLAEVAIRSVVKSLDPYSKYLTKEEVEKQTNSDNGYSGKSFGFNYYAISDTSVVTYINTGGAADIAGLLKGDQLISMDGRSLIGNRQVLGDADKDDSVQQITLQVLRNRTESITLTVDKILTPSKSVLAAFMVTGEIGYIKLGSFTLKTMDEFSGSLEFLKSIGMQSLILDLRGNAGGVKDQAAELADVFLSGDKLIYYQDGTNTDRVEYRTKEDGAWEWGKLVIMQDRRTASASEIFVGAMQDWDRAVIIGEPSYGKGLVQQSYRLGDGSNIRLTIGRYYTPSGRHIQRDEEGCLDNYIDAFKANALTHQVKGPESIFMNTMGDRKVVYCDGGIVPDIYYLWEDPDQVDLNNLLESNKLYNFVTQYVLDNRQALMGEYKSVSHISDDRIREAFMLRDLRRYVSKWYPQTQLPNNFPNNVIHKMKVWLVSQLWHDNAYYEMESKGDRSMYRAREIIENKLHDKLGVKWTKDQLK